MRRLNGLRDKLAMENLADADPRLIGIKLQNAMYFKRISAYDQPDRALGKPLNKDNAGSAYEYIGWDLDGSLAYYDHWRGPDHIGEPIPAAVHLVQTMLREGKRVVIFTARVGGECEDENQYAREVIQAWTKEHIGEILEVTAIKRPQMIEYYDDRAKQVVMNTGAVL